MIKGLCYHVEVEVYTCMAGAHADEEDAEADLSVRLNHRDDGVAQVVIGAEARVFVQGLLGVSFGGVSFVEGDVGALGHFSILGVGG